jgi:dTMP kinase
MAKYICIEGTDGVGKTTQVELLHQRLDRSIVTNEPGSKACPLTLELRKIILDAKWDNFMTPLGRDYLFQACRSIGLEKIVYPSLKDGHFVISDRSALSGLCYEIAAGISSEILWKLFYITIDDFCKKMNRDPLKIYDIIIILDGKPKINLQDKKEFEAGDTMELRGDSFMEKVRRNMQAAVAGSYFTCPMIIINVDGKSKEEVNDEIWATLIREKII